MECGSYLKMKPVVRYDENGYTNKAYVCDMNEWMLRGTSLFGLAVLPNTGKNVFLTAIKMYVYEQ